MKKLAFPVMLTLTSCKNGDILVASADIELYPDGGKGPARDAGWEIIK